MPSLSPLSSLDSTYNANVSRNCEEAELGTWRATKFILARNEDYLAMYAEIEYD